MDQEGLSKISTEEVLKRLQKARADHDLIYAQLRLRNIISRLFMVGTCGPCLALLLAGDVGVIKTIIAIVVSVAVLVVTTVIRAPWRLRHSLADRAVLLYEAERQRRIRQMG